MYANYFGFSDLPFQLTPDHRFFFGSSSHTKALAHLTFGISQGEGFIVITGEVGAGKTTLLGRLLTTLDKKQYVASAIMTSQLQGDDVLRLAAMNFGLDSSEKDKATILSELKAFLIARHREGKRCLLMVDEAQNLSFEALEELRMLSNLTVEQKPLLQSFLLAQPQFKEILARPELEQLRQRVIAAYHLGPLDREETRDYVKHRMHAVGWDEEHPSFTDGAYEEIFEATEGIPRVINNLCSRVLLYACLEEMQKINADTIRSVADDQRRETAEVMAEAGTQQPSRPVNGKAALASLPASAGAGDLHELYSQQKDILAKLEKMEARITRLEVGLLRGIRAVFDHVSDGS